MRFIATRCPSGPGKTRACLAFFGVDYQIYLLALLISVVLGFLIYFISIKIRKKEFETTKFMIKSGAIALFIFILISIILIWGQSQAIY